MEASMTDPRGEAERQWTNTSAPMTRREIEDARDHLKAWFPNQSVERHTFNKLCDQAVRSLRSATPASEALRRLSEDVMRCIDASWKPGHARDYGNLGPILAEYIDDLRKSAIPAAFNAPAGWHPDEPDAPPPASAASFEAIRDAIAIRMSGHTISEHDGKAWDTFMFLLRAVKASECAVSETAPSGTAKVPEGWLEELRYLRLSTAPDGQWADQAVHSFVGAMLTLHAAAPSPDGNEESK
jgi:hypothetical protein